MSWPVCQALQKYLKKKMTEIDLKKFPEIPEKNLKGRFE
jgi:hypothetical protein